MRRRTILDKTEDLEPLLISLARLLSGVALPGLAVPKSQIVLALKIRAHLMDAPDQNQCWLWCGKSRDLNGKSGVIVHDGHRYRARRVMVEWLIGKGFQYHYIKPACGQPWCHNPFHQRVLPIKSKSPGHIRDVCSRGHSLLDPENIKVSTSNGRTHRTCLACQKLKKETSYKYLSRQIKKQNKVNKPTVEY